ncbi:MAG: DNRLRE domain-containing protein [Planctomycetes bacterium]|nr:DNRLRE domain-containing protein [Planctomycetota bacterium]MCB9888422.1 DNRLRE domain-containing protein [Planctomycetota bacterium]
MRGTAPQPNRCSVRGSRTTGRRIAAVCCAACLGTALAGQSTDEWWVSFASRESATAQPPVLSVRGKDGFAIDLLPTADAPLLSYLGARPFGHLRELPVGLGDKNRSLLQFALPARLQQSGIAHAELRLAMKLGAKPPRRPITLAVHPVEQAWRESTVCWNRQPPFSARPLASAQVAARAGVVRIELTELVEAWRSGARANHGILLRDANARPGALLADALPARLLRTVPWTGDVRGAFRQANVTGKPVLTCVRGAYDAKAEDPAEQMLQAIAFCDPEVIAVVRREFVPLRLAYAPTAYTAGRAARPDPLTPIGTRSTSLKALALCVSTPSGELVSSLENIGTFDPRLVLAFLRHSLRRAGRAVKIPERSPERIDQGLAAMHSGAFDTARKILDAVAGQSPPTTRDAEARYWLGCVEIAAGQGTRGTATLMELHERHKTSPWAVKAAVRLAWPDRIEAAEPLRQLPPPLPEAARSTELALRSIDAARGPALDFLLAAQRADGSWPSEAGMYRAAITALAAKALEVSLPHCAAERRARVDGATTRAAAWIEREMRDALPEEANTFGTTYLLDYALTRFGRMRDDRAKALVTRAIDLVEKAQCPNGGWSYSRQFGTGWRGGFGGWPTTTLGRTHSVNTGPALLMLAAAKAGGFPIDAKRMERGVDALMRMRMAAGAYTYTFPVPLNFRRPAQSIARGPVCEQALWACGRVDKDDLNTALSTFLQHHSGLRRAKKIDASWSTPDNYSCYFYTFAYYHAAAAARAAGGEVGKQVLAAVRAELLATAEIDGTWVDFQQTGKPYGTAMALLALALTE